VPSPQPRAVFEAFIQALNRGDAAALRGLVHPDYIETYPQSGERIRGVENLRAIIEGYPGGYEDKGTDRVVGSEDRWVMTPAFTLLRIEGAGDTFTGVQKIRYPDGNEWYAVSIGEIRDGRVWRMQTFFAQPFEAPAWRSSWVEAVQTAKE
jgi:SnoaL-like domain